MDNLPETEQRVVDILKLHSPEWIVSGDIAYTLGIYQNHCAKCLSFLIKKGLVESQYVEKDSKKENYKEYRLLKNEPNEPAKAISIQQPWAWLIVNGIKDIENRDWYCKHRGLLYIHTGKKFDNEGWDYIYHTMKVTIPESESDYERGGIIGAVTMTDCVTESDSKWFFGKYGFVFRTPQKIDFIPYKGQLGIFNVEKPVQAPEAILEKVQDNHTGDTHRGNRHAYGRFPVEIAPILDAPYIYRENRAECISCPIYFQLATDGKKCKLNCRGK